MAYKSLQGGVESIPATTDVLSVDLDFPVKEDKAIIRIEVQNIDLQGSDPTDSGDYLFAPELDTIVNGEYTKFTLRRWYLTPGGREMIVKWAVIELTDSGNVESGVTQMTVDNIEETIGNYQADKTYSSAYFYSNSNTIGTGIFSEQFCQHRVYNNGVNDVIRLRNRTLGSQMYIYWQSIYDPDNTVEMQVYSLANLNLEDITLSRTFDTSRTIIQMSMRMPTPSMSQRNFKVAHLLNSTTVRVESIDNFNGEIVFYAIENSNITIKERSNVAWTGPQNTYTLSTPTNKDRSYVNLPYIRGSWTSTTDTVQNHGYFGTRSELITISGDNFTQLKTVRGFSGGAIYTYFEIVELTLQEDQQYINQRRISKGLAVGICRGC